MDLSLQGFVHPGAWADTKPCQRVTGVRDVLAVELTTSKVFTSAMLQLGEKFRLWLPDLRHVLSAPLAQW